MKDLDKGTILKKRERKADRDGILANFQFYIDDRSKEIFEGMTINISSEGFGFFTEINVIEGQTITITKIKRKNAMPAFAGQKARLIWIRKGARYVEAGAKFLLPPLPG